MLGILLLLGITNGIKSTFGLFVGFLSFVMSTDSEKMDDEFDDWYDRLADAYDRKLIQDY